MLLAERSGDVQALGAGPTRHHHRVYTQLCSASPANATQSGTLSAVQATCTIECTANTAYCTHTHLILQQIPPVLSKYLSILGPEA